MLIWLGDFNYRVNCSYEDAKEYIQHGWIKELLAKVSSSCLSRLCRACLLAPFYVVIASVSACKDGQLRD